MLSFLAKNCFVAIPGLVVDVSLVAMAGLVVEVGLVAMAGLPVKAPSLHHYKLERCTLHHRQRQPQLKRYQKVSNTWPHRQFILKVV
jgi:hypothetical protein